MSDYRRLIGLLKMTETALMQELEEPMEYPLERDFSAAQDTMTNLIEKLEFRQEQGEVE